MIAETFRPPLRVGLLLPVWFSGGLERYHLALASHTSPAIEWAGCVLTERAPTLQSSIDELAAIMPVYGTMQLADKGLNAMERIIRYATVRDALQHAPDCDVIMTWGVRDLSILNNVQKPIVLTSHGGCDWTANMLEAASSKASHFAAVSKAAALAFPRQYQGKAVLQPAGIDLARIKPRGDRAFCRRLIGVSPEMQLVGYVGRFSPEKHPYRAAEIVGQLGAPYVAVMHGGAVVGDSDVRAHATRLAKGRVLFLDRSWHLGDVLTGLDCLIQASPSEGGPLVALEAWCAGLPMVSTDVGLIRDDKAHTRDITTILPVDAPLSDWITATEHACTATARDRSRDAVPRMRARYGAKAMADRWEKWLLHIGRRAN